MLRITLIALFTLFALAACTVSLNVALGSVVVYVQPQSGVWTTTTPEATPTQETPTETVVFETPRPLTWMRNVTAYRYAIRQCPSTDCVRVGWFEPDALIEVDEHTATGNWLQVFRDDFEVGWVWSAALDYEHG